MKLVSGACLLLHMLGLAWHDNRLAYETHRHDKTHTQDTGLGHWLETQTEIELASKPGMSTNPL